MERTIPEQDKFDLQQNYRRYLKFQDKYDAANTTLKGAKASRVWLAGLASLLFSFGSEFFLGASFALFALYFYRIATAWYDSFQIDEGREELLRWFATNDLRFEGRILYFREDQLLENPLDPFADEIYV
ncbi:hypothetical protein [Amphritea balenae]|uniref:Uncharacterized protein n=1 Tax=Amphritea balenae TaxID=452629 RepID=A0A3P1SJF4_9GAMM|nr:hypothetical protein [Amphritea balenae]RRC96875.1 hypothetical protein EHS89_20195 [Amphritea balenae]GGK60940.1 hypothetical protein GCM10007941_08970 [Amphritea balenae]